MNEIQADPLAQLRGQFSFGNTISRATSPGDTTRRERFDDSRRYRPRTFNYFNLLPYPIESEAERDAALDGILRELYISLKAEDISPGSLHWTRELQRWQSHKFDMPRELRARLVHLFYHLSFARGVNPAAADRYIKTVISLSRYVHTGSPLSWDSHLVPLV